jgi:hypothetical protein
MNKRPYFITFILLTIFFVPTSLRAQDRIQHEIKVYLYPSEHLLLVEDRIRLPENLPSGLRFRLHKGLRPLSLTPDVTLVSEGEEKTTIPVESFRVQLPAGVRTFVLRYGGKIHHPLGPYGKEVARGFRQTPGTISEEGVFLSGGSFWYPKFDQEWVSFDLLVELPPEWDAVSQGDRKHHIKEKDVTRVRWESPVPQDEIYLIAAQFTKYTRSTGRVKAMAFLRSPDEQLAGRYLDATDQYVKMYEGLIGLYPYGKFALVENFWETGLGMPSFTLLGQKIIRFPFILHSSYPHEILHNWWGNSVFPDYKKGNWSEGLTAYLSDHLIQEQRNNGVNYRQTSLQKYTDYVTKGTDFSLEDFGSRHDSLTESVGYGKSLMFFHMLRLYLGDEVFRRGLQEFYRENKFRRASFDDIRRSFERVSNKDLGIEFNQWVNRIGAPKLRVDKVKVEKEGSEFLLTAHLEQTQSEVYSLRVPYAVTLKSEDEAFFDHADMKEKNQELKIHLPSRPLRLDIDPQFDLFRKLDRREIPPALTQAFGAKKVLIILPSSSDVTLLRGYRELGRSWSRSGPGKVEMKLDTEVNDLPSDRAVVLFGWENRFLDEFTEALTNYEVSIEKQNVTVQESQIPRANHSVVLTARNPKNIESAFTWVATDRVEAIPGLCRKLPHYHKYSYLGFEGSEPTNMVKGGWPILDSPMTVFISDEKGTYPKVKLGRLPTRVPLAVLPPVFSIERMLETIRSLSADTLEGRGLGTEGLDRAAEYIAMKFKEVGLRPAGDRGDSYFQIWKGQGKDLGRNVILKNVIGTIPGQKRSGESVVVGAHYDHLGLGWPDVRRGNEGKIHHGADDNASGVAVLIELARVLNQSMKPDRTLVFVAFTGEESGKKGSKYYVANDKTYPVEQCIGMINLDTVGRLEKKKLLILGAGSAREWDHIFRGAGFVTGVEIESVSEELDSSDQKSFQEAGVPAVQLFSGPHLDYHRPTDTKDKIDPDGLVKVASVAKEALEYLVGREGPLSSSLRGDRGGDEGLERSTRRVSLGTLPDFAFRGSCHSFPEGCIRQPQVPKTGRPDRNHFYKRRKGNDGGGRCRGEVIKQGSQN